MANIALTSKIKKNGINQQALFALLNNLVEVVEEMRADHATIIAAVDAIAAQLDGDSGVGKTTYAALHGSSGSSNPWPTTLTANTAITLGS